MDERAGQTTSRTIQSIRRVDLRVRDVERSLGFYGGVVGLEVAHRSSSHAALRAPDGATLLTLESDGVTRPAEKEATGLFHTAIRFPTRQSLGRALGRLVAAGLEIGAGDHGVSEALYIDDPDGNGVELYWDRPRSEWPSPAPGERVGMYTKAVDLQDLYEEGRGSGLVDDAAPASTDVGHVHLQVRDVDETAAFYTNVLGLDLMAKIGSQAAFLSSLDYHHNIGANAWNSRGSSPASEDHAGLRRVIFTTDDAEIEALKGRMAASGHAYEEDAGELVLVDPNGIELRFVT